MPLEKMEAFERHPALSLRAWKSGQVKQLKFLNDGRDVTVPNVGASVVFDVIVGNNKQINSLWVRPGGALHIGLNEFIPLKGKTLMVEKEILKGEGVQKGTRYYAKMLEQEELK